MTIKEAYKYLESVRRIECEIRKQQLKRDALQSCLLPKAISYDKDSVQTSPEDKMSEIAAEVLDTEKRLRALAARKYATVQNVSESIARLDSEDEQIVLLGCYIAGRSVPAVSELVHYSTRQTYRIRRRAVRNLAAKMSQMAE